MRIVSPWLTLGYVIPHLYTDMHAYQFYRVAPDGMMLVTTGLNLKEYSLAGVETELPALWPAFRRHPLALEVRAWCARNGPSAGAKEDHPRRPLST